MERLSDPFEDIDVHRDHPDVIAKPPTIALLFLIAGLAIDQMVPSPDIYEPVQYLGGAGLLIGGLALVAAAMRQFRAVGTAVETWRASTMMVSDALTAPTSPPETGASR